MRVCGAGAIEASAACAVLADVDTVEGVLAGGPVLSNRRATSKGLALRVAESPQGGTAS